MSDPVKNADIEDVLSSIRRLVSENHVHVPKAAVAVEPAMEPKPRPASDRLVLSPALRIQEPVAEAAVEPSVAPAEEARPEVMSPVEDTPFANSLQEDILPLRESLPSFLKKRLAQSEKRTEAPVETPVNGLQTAVEAEPDHPEDTPSAQIKDALNFVHETVDASVEEQPLDETHDASAAQEADNTLHFPAPQELTFGSARAPRVEPAADPTPSRDVSQEATRPWEIEGERLAEWHSVRSAEADGFDPDGPEDGDNAAAPVATLNWEDHETEEAEPQAVAVEEVAPAKPQPAADPVAEHIAEAVAEEVAPREDTIDAQQYDAVLDEEMLRELVGEIVRQELQGPLGERITRNVRKLVRREINRALTARNFNDG